MANLKFYEAVLRDSLPISREYADKGWPPVLYPFFLALVQMPDADRPAQKAFTLHMGDSIRAGALPAVRQRIPWFIENEVIEPHVTAQDFAVWLARGGVTPSPLVCEWFEHEGVASPAPAPAPTQTAAAPASVVVASASNAPSNGKVWTPERLAEVRAYREKHGTKKTAEHFKVSASLIRQKLPSEKPKPKGYSAFTHRIK